tara:strand:- start:23 stop:889 length:867 start_codon:yes stop_codon:yes gene_type:complete
MTVRFVTYRAAALIAAALFFGLVGCAGPRLGTGAGAGVDPDAIDQGGQLQVPTPVCKGADSTEADDDVLYRYVARTFGGQARIDEFCVAEANQDRFTFQPPEGMEGSCPGALCGQASTWRRGPIEHAMLQAIVSLERSTSTRLEAMRRSNQTVHDLYQVDLVKGTTRFRLAEGVQCIANLETFKEQTGHGARAGDEVISPEKLTFFYGTEASISRGSIWVEQKQHDGGHDLMVIIESAFEGHYEAELFKETILCKSTSGVISALSSPVYGFSVNRASLDEWSIQAFRR